MRPSAGRQNLMGDLLNQRDTANSAIVDDLGISTRPPRMSLGDRIDLVRVCLYEDHPGYGVVFLAWLGVWDPATNSWDYDPCETGTGTDAATLVYCIDWWYSDIGPYPLEGATGLAVARASNTYGTIYEIVSMDCDSPGACCTGT